MTGNSSSGIAIKQLKEKGGKDSRHEDAILESGLITLWHTCRWLGPAGVSVDNVGLIFPPGKDSIERVEKEAGRVKIFAALQGDAVVGACILHLGSAIGNYATKVVDFLGEIGSPHPAFIRSLCVSPTVRRKGIGRMLLNQAKCASAEYGAAAVAGNVLLEPHTNHRLVTAYENAGFVKTAERLHYSRQISRDMNWICEGREDFLPHEIDLTYACMVAPVEGFTLSPSDTGLFLTKKATADNGVAVS